LRFFALRDVVAARVGNALPTLQFVISFSIKYPFHPGLERYFGKIDFTHK